MEAKSIYHEHAGVVEVSRVQGLGYDEHAGVVEVTRIQDLGYDEHAGVVEVPRVQGLGHQVSAQCLRLQLVAHVQGSEDGLNQGWGTIASNAVLSPGGVGRYLAACRRAIASFAQCWRDVRLKRLLQAGTSCSDA